MRRAYLWQIMLVGVVMSTGQSCGSKPANPNVAPSNDILVLAKEWWGLDPAAVIAKAGLAPGSYSRGPHPVRKDVEVIVPSRGRWDPPELQPLAFEFAPGKGLTEINGTYRGKREDVVAAMVVRYGKYDKTLEAVGLVTCVWERDGSIFEIAPVLFRITPRKG